MIADLNAPCLAEKPRLLLITYNDPDHLVQVPDFVGLTGNKGTRAKASLARPGDIVVVRNSRSKGFFHLVAVRRVTGMPELVSETSTNPHDFKWSDEVREGRVIWDTRLPVTDAGCPRLKSPHVWWGDLRNVSLYNQKGRRMESFESLSQFFWANFVDPIQHGAAYDALFEHLFGKQG